MDHPAFILVRPQMGENIGAAARGMLNFGLTALRVVDPRDGWPNPRAIALASGAARLLDDARIAPDTGAAIGDLDHVYATSARLRGLTTPVLTPEEAMRDAALRIAAGGRVGILFGPERTGLENEDIARANTLVSVPVNPDFPSLNLAQCVLLMAYEWRRQTRETPARSMHLPGQARPANAAEMEALARRLEDSLEAADFFWPDHKAAPMRLSLRNLVSRLDLTDADVRTLHGAIRALVRGPGTRRRRTDTPE
ncbi:MAG: RNA methyltransferase [Rhodobacteraceae bacterium]|nr:RNA methyltransferase [Paracoccaceae bacterium]